MKTIGLLGGMSWESTVTYYVDINNLIKEKLGGLHSAKILLLSVDFYEIEKCQAAGEWEKSGELLGEAAERLEKAGADFIVICTNTMHKVAPLIQSRIGVPLLHIADAAASKLKALKIRKAALLGTKYTMEQDFYKDRLADNGIEVLIPDPEEREVLNGIIYNELCLGIISDDSRQKVIGVINKLSEKGAEAMILGCTEIGLLVRGEDTGAPLLDTAKIHAERAALFAMGE